MSSKVTVLKAQSSPAQCIIGVVVLKRAALPTLCASWLLSGEQPSLPYTASMLSPLVLAPRAMGYPAEWKSLKLSFICKHFFLLSWFTSGICYSIRLLMQNLLNVKLDEILLQIK